MKLKLSTAVNLINVLIVVSIIAAAGVAGALIFNLVAALPTIKVSEPSLQSSNSSVTVSLVVSASNPGPFPISGIYALVSLADSQGTLANAHTAPVEIAPGARDQLIPIDIPLDLAGIAEERLIHLMREYETININASAVGSIPPLLTIGASSSLSLSWKPLVKDLRTGTVEVSPHNASHMLVQVPLSFENPSDFIPLAGLVSGEGRDPFGRSFTFTQGISAEPGSNFSQDINFYWELPENLTDYLFIDTTFQIPLAVNVTVFNFTLPLPEESLQFDWGAPVKGLNMSQPQVSRYNWSHSELLSSLSFANNSTFLAINGSARASLYGVDQVLLGTSDPILIDTPPGGSFSSPLRILVKNSLLWLHQPATLKIEIQTDYGGFEREVAISG